MSTPDELSRIVEQMERGWNGDAWAGTPLRAMVMDIDAATAARRSVSGAHTIWELVLHITSWLDIVRRRLRAPVTPTAEQDWPAVGSTTPEAWQDALGKLESAHDMLLGALFGLEESDLERIVPGKDYTVYVMLHGIIQHNVYHEGQIALLKKAG